MWNRSRCSIGNKYNACCFLAVTLMLIIGIHDMQLRTEERDWVRAPAVSGIILFARNFASREQVTELIAEIRALRPGPFLLCVDQEGGPVQRFRHGFTRLPALARIGEEYARDRKLALALAEEHAWLMATEMRATGRPMPDPRTAARPTARSTRARDAFARGLRRRVTRLGIRTSGTARASRPRGSTHRSRRRTQCRRWSARRGRRCPPERPR